MNCKSGSVQNTPPQLLCCADHSEKSESMSSDSVAIASFSSTPSATMFTAVPFTIPSESTPSRLFALTRRSSLSIQMLLLNSLAFWMKKVAGRA